MQEPNLYSVKGIAILDNDGNRIFAKVRFLFSFLTIVSVYWKNFLFQYYGETFSSVKDQKAFERNLFNKTHRANGEVIMLDGFTCIYRNSVDLFFYIMGNSNENGVWNDKFDSQQLFHFSIYSSWFWIISWIVYSNHYRIYWRKMSKRKRCLKILTWSF